MSVVTALSENSQLIVLVGPLFVLYARAQRQFDRRALAVAIASLVGIAAVRSYPGASSRVVLAASIAGALACVGTTVAVFYDRL